MSEKIHPQKLKAFPVQLIDIPNGLLVKRGCTEFKISGSEARTVVETILAAAADEGAALDDICELFPPSARRIVATLVEQLAVRRILVNGDEAISMTNRLETSLDIFYWHFGKQSEPALSRLNRYRFTILGVTSVARQLVASLADLQITNFEVIDYPLLRNLRMYDDTGTVAADHWPSRLKSPLDYEEWTKGLQSSPLDCVIATSDFGYSPAISEWNEFCVRRNCHFLPAVLHQMIGYVGPLVIPGETACFECLRARQNAHIDNPSLHRAAEERAFEGQIITGFHPSMTSILGSITAFELERVYGAFMPKPQVGRVITINLLNTEVKSRKVMKVPRCPACSPLLARSGVTPYKDAFIHSSDEHL